MGDVGSITIDLININLNPMVFREVQPSYPEYVIDNRDHIEIPEEKWYYRYSKNIIVFGEGSGQPINRRAQCSLSRCN
jgi:hypothetical protein